MSRIVSCAFAALILATACHAAETNVPSQPWFPKAPPLPAPKDPIVRVNTVEELFQAAENVRPGGTILVADGHYFLPRTLFLKTNEVTLRSASGNRHAVLFDGSGRNAGELVAVSSCTGVTIADLTIQNIAWNGFKINTNTGVDRVTIHNCVIHNIWQRGVKGVAGAVKDGKRVSARDCHVEFCLFYNDRPKRYADDSYEEQHPTQFGGNYVGGMDLMSAQGWVIRDNVFLGIHGRTGEARGAIFIWNQSSDCTIERNTIIDCDTGIYLGSAMRQADTKVHCTGFMVRNNFVTRTPEGAITAIYTHDCKILNNTIHDPTNKLGRSIRLAHDNEGMVIANNLISGPRIEVARDAGRIEVRKNLERIVPEYFMDAASGNLHLTNKAAGAIGQAETMREVTDDIDRGPRGPKPSLGAHEFGRSEQAK